MANDLWDFSQSPCYRRRGSFVLRLKNAHCFLTGEYYFNFLSLEHQMHQKGYGDFSFLYLAGVILCCSSFTHNGSPSF